MMMNSCFFMITSSIRQLTQIFRITYTLHLTLTNSMNLNAWPNLDLENGILWLFKFLPSFNASKGVFVTVSRVCLYILLRRLSYPCRYGDMIQRFAKPVLIRAPEKHYSLVWYILTIIIIVIKIRYRRLLSQY